MDTITHGIAGALIAKAVCNGDDLFPVTQMTRRRIVTWSLMLGSIFPDSDVFREMLSHNPLLLLTWHRSITHSFLCLPLWAVLLAALTRQLARWRKWDAPSFLALCALWAIGIASHIFLDLATTFGTMIWSPLEWSRPAWDILFIIDFTFTAILLVPQWLAWTFKDPKRVMRRAYILCLIFIPAPLIVGKIAQFVGTPVSNAAVLITEVLLVVLFLFPAISGWGVRVSYLTWNRAGLALAVCYVAAATYAHHVALDRMENFAEREGVRVESIGALPFPPSLWHWDGLVRSSRGVYEVRMDLSDSLSKHGLSGGDHPDPDVIQHTYYPDAFPNRFIDEARQLPEVQKVLWFARFPVTRFHIENGQAVVQFADLRFAQIRPDQPASFVYEVRFSKEGQVQSQGWLRK